MYLRFRRNYPVRKLNEGGVISYTERQLFFALPGSAAFLVLLP